MSEIVFFLEELSAAEMLKGFLPKLLGEAAAACKYIVFEGKQDLEKQLVRRMRLYRVPGAKFIVLRDKDAGDCKEIKGRLCAMCKEARRPDALVRIACHELESWYLADLAAVETGLNVKGLLGLQNSKMYVAPDRYPAPSRTLHRLVPAYQKVGGSRAIGPHLDPRNTRSRSFKVFVEGLLKLAAR
jgi:hypothetical protein